MADKKSNILLQITKQAGFKEHLLLFIALGVIGFSNMWVELDPFFINDLNLFWYILFIMTISILLRTFGFTYLQNRYNPLVDKVNKVGEALKPPLNAKSTGEDVLQNPLKAFKLSHDVVKNEQVDISEKVPEEKIDPANDTRIIVQAPTKLNFDPDQKRNFKKTVLFFLLISIGAGFACQCVLTLTMIPLVNAQDIDNKFEHADKNRNKRYL